MQPTSKAKLSMKKKIQVIVIGWITSLLMALAFIYFARVTDPSAILGIFVLFSVLGFVLAVATIAGAVPDYV